MTNPSILPDAAPANWVDRHAPAPLRPWLKLGRFDRPAGIWLLMLPGWQGVALASSMQQSWPKLWPIVAITIGAALMRAAGCAYNDIVDRDIDAKVARTALRPIPSGRISVKQAWAFVIGCSLISLTILLTLNIAAVALGVVSLILVAAYPFMKRITWWPQAWLGLTFNWGALMGFAAATGLLAASQSYEPYASIGMQSFLIEPWPAMPSALPLDVIIAVQILESLPALLLYLALVFWTLGYDTIYALQDIEDDAMVGVKSSARRLGAGVRRGVGSFYIVTVVLTAGAGAIAGLGPLFSLGLLAFAAHLGWQINKLRPDDPALALRLFRSNRDAGFILLFAIILGAVSWPF